MIAKKSFGQHFLQDASVIKKIVDAAKIQSFDMVLEIGPGHGVLTEALVKAGANVVAVEADRDLIEELQKTFDGRAQIIFADALKFDPKSIFDKHAQTHEYQLVANLPYNIASAVIEKFLTAKPAPKAMVIMVQKEVVDRMLAKPGEMSILSLACQLYADGERVTDVPPGAFRPMPKVDSTVVRLELKEKTKEDREAIIALAKLGFRSRRKQLQRNFVDAKLASATALKAIFTELELPITVRAQELSPEQWISLYLRLKASAIL